MSREITKDELNKILKELAKERPIFHSEADFQFALAWKIKKEFNDVNVRLEYPIYENETERMEIDIVLFFDEKMIPIELKYKTKKMEYSGNNNENYKLKDQVAYNYGCYDYLRDIERIENIIKSETFNGNKGYTIFLTNDEEYKGFPQKDDCDSSAFSFKKGKIEKGEHAWKKPETKKEDKQNTIVLKNDYDCEWEIFSNIKDTEFTYLIHEIK